MNNYYIASISWGKDSLAMLLLLIEKDYPLDEVVFYDTGMEFQAIYDEIKKWIPLLEANGIKYTELKPKESFLSSMFLRPVKKRGTNIIHKHGYGWCGGVCRWGTTDKQREIDRYAEDRKSIVYIGIAVDETERLDKEVKTYKSHPLAEWGMTEQDCLELCYSQGASWTQGGTRLYYGLDRVSCWCCRNKNLKELKWMCQNLPDYWERLKGMEERIGIQMKPKGWLHELEEDFKKGKSNAKN